LWECLYDKRLHGSFTGFCINLLGVFLLPDTGKVHDHDILDSCVIHELRIGSCIITMATGATPTRSCQISRTAGRSTPELPVKVSGSGDIGDPHCTKVQLPVHSLTDNQVRRHLSERPMIDLHCHLLPGIDDGAKDLETALAMARMAVADGIRVLACTPHVYPGMFENDSHGIRAAIEVLQTRLDEEGIALRLVIGADAHMTPELPRRLKEGTVPSLGGTRYFLLEPPHHVSPPRLDEYVFNLLAVGLVPVVTHPERLTWIEEHYELFQKLVRQGAWMQVTAGSLTGRFGDTPRYWGERMLDEGLVHILATDAHSARGRPPLLAEAREAASRYVGQGEARNLVEVRPAGILANRPPDKLPALPARSATTRRPGRGILKRLFGLR
jgi:protein-tyrosine phosphatase